MFQLRLFLLLIPVVCCVDTTLWELVYTDVSYLSLPGKLIWGLRNSGPASKGFVTEEWDNTNGVWNSFAGECKKISQDMNNLYCIQNDYVVKKIVNTINGGYAWQDLNIQAHDFKVGTNGQIFYTSTTARVDGFTLYQYDPIGGTSTTVCLVSVLFEWLQLLILLSG